MKRRKCLVLFSLFLMNLVDQPAPEVETDLGVVSGKINSDGTILEYLGIPYATAERFQAPRPPAKWNGVFKAIDGSIQCPQPSPIGVVGTEDCLRINVYVPAKSRRGLPVMVYIHGGAFLLGNGGKMLLGPDFLLKHDVILVTFNYRLGALGFLCLGIKEAPGNAGLKDQMAALKWVQRNIAAFGGDPDNVTIFGTSAGATSVSLLLANEGTNGLFNKVIAQSGSALVNWAINREPISQALSVAKKLGSYNEDPLDLYEFYKNVPFKDLIETTANIPVSRLLDLNLLHLPCVEKKFPGIEPAISDLPYNLLSKNPKNVSVIYGSTDKEGLFFIAEETTESLKGINEKRHILRDDLVFSTEEEAVSVSAEVRQFYFGSEDISHKTIMNLSDLYSHLYFEEPAILEAEVMLNKVEAPIYNYHFTYSGGRNMVKEKSGFVNESGACHGDDILYVFHALIWPYKIKPKDQVVIDRMTKMWTNFAKFGDPTPKHDSELPVKWEPSNKHKWNFLYIGEDLKMGPIPNPDSFKLWKNIYDKYRNLNA